MLLSKASSITHEHLLSVINTEMDRFPETAVIKILDVGCGNGKLILYLAENLPRLKPSNKFEVYGFDVNDHGVQTHGFFEKTIDKLKIQFPDIPWEERVVCITAADKWPYQNEFFDIIISNQVGEHINDHAAFFSEINRTLQQNGFSVHLFPLRHYILEGHLLLPFAHRILNYDILRSYIKLLSRLKLGKYKAHNRETGISLERFVERHADYIHYFTNYISYKDALVLAKKSKMRISFRYTREYYSRKLCSLFGVERKYKYARRRSSLLDLFSLIILRYIDCVTMNLEKKEKYTSS